ncbi:MAG: uracil-DNA glycosylase [Rubrobacter sp.]|nr:uracil-DNA glycosylase [Rubrobacter sp.]
MDLLTEHRNRVRACSLCFPTGGNAPVVDLPKCTGILLVAQAPGSTEVVTHLPFTGPAGERLMCWFERAVLSREDVYLSAVCRCFPGKAKGGAHGGDLPPSRTMIRNCRPHLLREFELLQPKVVVPAGGLAIKELLRVTRLSEAVGETFERGGITYVPLPHPSGASTWLNAPENKERLARALAALREQAAAPSEPENGSFSI